MSNQVSNSVDVFFGEIKRGAEAAARRKIANEVKKMRRELVGLKKIKANFDKELEKQVNIKVSLQAKKSAALKEREGLLKQREMALSKRLSILSRAEQALAMDINTFKKIGTQTVQAFIMSHRRYSYNRRFYSSAMAAIRNRKKK
jgi:hypothetical protein